MQMADEGEIDVLGDFDFKLEAESDIYDANELPSKSANLLPEYTNPPWMLEQGWPLDIYMDEKSKATIEKMLLEEQYYVNGKGSSRGKARLSLPVSLKKGGTSKEQLTSSSSSSKPDQKRLTWTEEEKDLFHKGMEIYGRSWTKIAELIPSRSSVQIKNFAHQYFKQQKKEYLPQEESIQETMIASTILPVETTSTNPVTATLATVSTATTTVTVRAPILPKKGRIPKVEKIPTGFCQTSGLNTQSSSLKQKKGSKLKGRAHKLKKLNHFKGKHKSDLMTDQDRNAHTINSLHFSQEKSEGIIHGLLDHKMTITPGLIENLDGFCAVADIIAGDNEEEEEDDIDIENDDDNDINPVLQSRSTSPNSVYKKLLSGANIKVESTAAYTESTVVSDGEQKADQDDLPEPDVAQVKEEELDQDEVSCTEQDKEIPADQTVTTDTEISVPEKKEEKSPVKREVPKMIVNAVMTCDGEIVHFPIPTQAVTMETDAITDEEKMIHKEFFEQRPSKTPERYLKIRNYILDSWKKCQPSYLNKTSVRPGLKNCGDVNCIGRVHAYLECIGAINFGCEQALYNHPRPMLPFHSKERNSKDMASEVNAAKLEAMRPRKRKVRDEFGVWIDEKELEGKTIEHEEKIKEQGSKSAPKQQKMGYDPFKLIPCLSFNEEVQAPFQVEIHSSALIIMDIHSHICKTEVIGMLGGKFCLDQGKLTITMATPCNSISTGMQCEMDPVSQTQASEEILGSGMDVVGWYHSHPTFAPNPSVRDIETQLKFQEWFSKGGSNFVGVIVSPYNPRNASLCSEINCLTVSKETLPLINCNIPYKFEYSRQGCDVSEINNIILTAQDLATSYTANKHRVDLTSVYSMVRQISCLEKMLESLKSHYPIETDSVSLLDSIRKAFEAPDGVGDFTRKDNIDQSIDSAYDSQNSFSSLLTAEILDTEIL